MICPKKICVKHSSGEFRHLKDEIRTIQNYDMAKKKKNMCVSYYMRFQNRVGR
jgi:hypothetical protein